MNEELYVNGQFFLTQLLHVGLVFIKESHTLYSAANYLSASWRSLHSANRTTSSAKSKTDYSPSRKWSVTVNRSGGEHPSRMRWLVELINWTQAMSICVTGDIHSPVYQMRFQHVYLPVKLDWKNTELLPLPGHQNSSTCLYFYLPTTNTHCLAIAPRGSLYLLTPFTLIHRDTLLFAQQSCVHLQAYWFGYLEYFCIHGLYFYNGCSLFLRSWIMLISFKDFKSVHVHFTLQ